MPRYHYKVIAADGRVQTGEMDAASDAVVVETLRARGQWVVQVENRVNAGGSRVSLFGSRVGDGDLGLIARETATLLRAGVPLDRSLVILQRIAKNRSAKKMLTEVLDKVRRGTSFSDALSEPSYGVEAGHLGVIRAGEAGGSLPDVLEQLAGFLEASAKNMATIRSALTYPSIVVFMAVAAIAFLVSFVLPQFEQLFETAGKALPPTAATVMKISFLLRTYWWAILGGLALLFLLLRLFASTSTGRLALSRLYLATPVLGDIQRLSDSARFSRTMALLLDAGVPVLNAVGNSREAVTSTALRMKAGGLEPMIRAGVSVADAMKRSGAFTDLSNDLCLVGEESGALPLMLRHAAELQEADVERKAKRAVELIAPITTLVLGAVVALIVVSVMTAVLSINQLV